jgi:hypothetical protein
MVHLPSQTEKGKEPQKNASDIQAKDISTELFMVVSATREAATPGLERPALITINQSGNPVLIV